jgi:hypothetical protein
VATAVPTVVAKVTAVVMATQTTNVAIMSVQTTEWSETGIIKAAKFPP